MKIDGMKMIAMAVATFATMFTLENAPDIWEALSHYFAGLASALALTLWFEEDEA